MNFKAKLAPLAFGCALLVAACGGGGGGVAGDTAAAASSLQVQSKSTGSVETVTVLDASTGETTSYQISKYLFSANVTAGKYSGKVLTGDLMLAAKEVGSNQLKGTLLLTVPTATAPDAALVQACRDATQAAYDEARAALKTATDKLNAALKAATTRAQEKAAKQAFEAEYQAASKAARDKASAACAGILAKTGGTMSMSDDDFERDGDSHEERDDYGRAIPVVATLAADGTLSITIKVPNLGSIRGTGKADATGSYSGTFKGPDTAGKGTWSATVGTGTPPPPPPPPAPPPPAPPPPPPAPIACAATTLTWSVGTSACSAATSSKTSGVLAQLTDTTAPTSGSATYSCTNGVWAMAPAPAPTCTTATPPPPPAPAPAPSAAAIAGKVSFASCAGCHGGMDPSKGSNKISAAATASNTLNAIAKNVGGMGFLSSTIGATEAANIAAYVKAPFAPF